MDIFWTKSKFNAVELSKKTVEFQISNGESVFTGTGEFSVRQNPDGELAVDIVTDVQGRNRSDRIQTSFNLSQAMVDRIEKHSDSSVAQFRIK